MGRRPKLKRGHRTKGSRELTDAVIKAGGTVERTNQGHLKITGPAGICFETPSPEKHNRTGIANKVKRYSGLNISPYWK